MSTQRLTLIQGGEQAAEAPAVLQMKIAPGLSDTVSYEVIEFDGKKIVARRNYVPCAAPETFTRRKNGNYALVGESQWSLYFRASEVASLPIGGQA